MAKIKQPENIEPIDLSMLFDDYRGRWVALDKFSSDFRVVASGASMEYVYKQAIKKGLESPVILKISEKPQLSIL